MISTEEEEVKDHSLSVKKAEFLLTSIIHSGDLYFVRQKCREAIEANNDSKLSKASLSEIIDEELTFYSSKCLQFGLISI